jgi:hypothetical protein
MKVLTKKHTFSINSLVFQVEFGNDLNDVLSNFHQHFSEITRILDIHSTFNENENVYECSFVNENIHFTVELAQTNWIPRFMRSPEFSEKTCIIAEFPSKNLTAQILFYRIQKFFELGCLTSDEHIQIVKQHMYNGAFQMSIATIENNE